MKNINEGVLSQKLNDAPLAPFGDFVLHGTIPDGPAYRIDRSRERALEAALFGLYQAWAKLPIPADRLRPYYAEKFRQMIVPGCKLYRGGQAAARHILFTSKSGLLDHLRVHSRMDLSIEALVLSGEWNDLFDPEDHKRAAENISRYETN